MPPAKRPATAATEKKAGFGTVLRRAFGRGFVVREGTLVLERLKRAEERSYLPAGVHGLGTVNAWYRVRFAETPEAEQGFVHASRILNRVEAGARVAIQVDPGDGYIRRVRPLDRRLRWWQH